jgi:hypothetical protein
VTGWSGTYQKSDLILGNQAFLISGNRYEERPYSRQIRAKVVHSVCEKKEKQNVFYREGSSLFFKNDLFLKTEIDNLRSNLTPIWTFLVFIA